MSIWIEDADEIKGNEKALDIIIFNPSVKEFLGNKNRLGIAGIKGQGKTFLLKVKRKRLQSTSDPYDQNVVCFPKNQLLDQLDSSIRLNKQLSNYLKEFNNWINLWKTCICITIISSKDFSTTLTKYDQEILNEKTLELIEESSMLNTDSHIRFVFNRLISRGKHYLSIVFNDTALLMDIISRINTGVCIFIDKVDQVFRNSSPSNNFFWQYSQYSLSCAAYDIFTINNHLKVYHSIRQEALIRTEKIDGEIKRNVFSFLSILKYSKNDLQDMFSLYIKNEDNNNLFYGKEKDSNAMKAFLGIDNIQHTYIKDNEPIIDYIYRHSLKRPYDIMRICKSLNLINKNEIDTEMIRRVVNEAAQDILNSYISELTGYINISIKDLETLLNMLNTNIFSKEYMENVCRRYHIYHNNFNYCKLDCISCNKLQIFSVLYNIGLLGYIIQLDGKEELRQEFRNIGESIIEFEECQLPNSKIFFLHPCLSDLAKKLRRNKGFYYLTNSRGIVGDKNPIKQDNIEMILKDIDKCASRFSDEYVFISSTVHDLRAERNCLKSCLEKRNYYPVMSDTPEFNQDSFNTAQVHSHDHCLDEILKCGTVICVIGKSYGGKYSGNKYKQECREIVERSNRKIKEPSISLMEYFIARTHNIKTYVFISLEYDTNLESWDEKCRKEYNFINHYADNDQIKGNWIIRYSSLDDFQNRVNKINI